MEVVPASPGFTYSKLLYRRRNRVSWSGNVLHTLFTQIRFYPFLSLFSTRRIAYFYCRFRERALRSSQFDRILLFLFLFPLFLREELFSFSFSKNICVSLVIRRDAFVFLSSFHFSTRRMICPLSRKVSLYSFCISWWVSPFSPLYLFSFVREESFSLVSFSCSRNTLYRL